MNLSVFVAGIATVAVPFVSHLESVRFTPPAQVAGSCDYVPVNDSGLKTLQCYMPATVAGHEPVTGRTIWAKQPLPLGMLTVGASDHVEGIPQ